MTTTSTTMTNQMYQPLEKFPPSNGSQSNIANKCSSQQQVVINMDDGREYYNARMSDYFAWSLWNLFIFNYFCLGFVATVFSIKSRDHKYLKDYVLAKKYSKIALGLNIACLVLFVISIGGIIFALIYFIEFITNNMQVNAH
uniref:interferon-induced transmembrane protein 1-like n=1 Tax=Myxine glutinosa TaxID=7769 RepID=UPI00358E4DA8